MIVKHRRSITAGVAPQVTDILDGEIALNTADAKLFIKDSNNNIQEIGTKNPISSTVSGTGKKVQNIIVLTQAEYDAIGTGNYDAGTVYLIEA